MNFFVNKFCWKLNGGPENFSGNFLHNSNNINLPRGSIWSSWNYHQSNVWSLVLKVQWVAFFAPVFSYIMINFFFFCKQDITTGCTKGQMKSFFCHLYYVSIICGIFSQLCPIVPRGFCQFLWGGQGLFFAGRGQLVFPRGEANIPGIAQWPENNLQIIHEDYKKWCWWCIGWSLCWCDLSEQLGRWRGATLYPLGCTTLAHPCTPLHRQPDPRTNHT